MKRKRSYEASYLLTQECIKVIETRQLTHGSIMPNFVVDLILPIVGFTGVGILALLNRRAHIERRVMTANLHDLARSGGIGFRKLQEKLDQFEELKLIYISKPEGIEKTLHKRTRIELLDPPVRLDSSYIDLIREKSPTNWLIEEYTD